MSSHPHRLIKSSSGVSIAILICRILGLVREMLLAMFLGGGMIRTGWSLAFAIPNLFRRLFGEGALGTALVPIITYTLEHEDRYSARKKMASIFVVLGIILAALSIIIAVGAIIISPYLTLLKAPPRVMLAFDLLPLLMPYTFFICLIGVLSSVLNSLGRFFLPALGAISFNLFMIIALVFVCPFFKDNYVFQLNTLSVFVLLSGVFQLAVMLFLLYREGMMPVFRGANLFSNPVLKEVYSLTLPGIIGASMVQISFLIDRGIACYLSDYAVPALDYSDRIIDLPIGIFAVAMGSVFLTDLSRHAAKKDFEKMISSLLFALRNIIFISIPIAVFIAFFRFPLLRLFYMRGKFGERELCETALAMQFFAFGIPFFCAIKIIVSGFHSRKDMKTPVKSSLICIVLNIIMNLILMWPLKQGGIALATVISSFANCAMLLYLLHKSLGNLHLSSIIPSVIKAIISATASLCIVKFLIYSRLELIPPIRYVPRDLLPLAIAGIAFVIIYLFISVLLRSKEPGEWRHILKT